MLRAILRLSVISTTKRRFGFAAFMLASPAYHIYSMRALVLLAVQRLSSLADPKDRVSAAAFMRAVPTHSKGPIMTALVLPAVQHFFVITTAK